MVGSSTQEIRDRAAELLGQCGWDPRGLGVDGPISGNAALGLAAEDVWDPQITLTVDDSLYLRAVGEVEDLLGRGSLLDWEMEPGRTADEVIQLLRSSVVAGGPYPPLTAEEQALQDLGWARSRAAAAREAEAFRQMKARAGPLYQLARERGTVLSRAYRAAGQPRDVTRARGPDGWVYMHQVHGGQRGYFEPATEEEWREWRQWVQQRVRMRRELGIGRYSDRPRG